MLPHPLIMKCCNFMKFWDNWLNDGSMAEKKLEIMKLMSFKKKKNT